MYVVIDTNILFNDMHLEGAKLRSLIQSTSRTGITVVIPQVVVDETKNKFHQRLQGHKEILASESAALGKLAKKEIKQSVDGNGFERMMTDYEASFNKSITDMGIKVVPYPNVPHSEIARKAMRRVKPFNANEKGYRDALIWENIKGLVTKRAASTIAYQPDVVFVTKNRQDFCESGNTDILHNDLKKELEEKGITDGQVKVVNDLETVIAEYVQPKLAVLENLQQKLNAGKHANLFAQLKSRVRKDLLHRGVDAYQLNMPDEYETVLVASVEDDDIDFTVSDVQELSEDEALLIIDASVFCEFDVFIHKSDIVTAKKDKDLLVMDDDLNDHYILGLRYSTMPIKIYATVSRDLKKLITHEVEIRQVPRKDNVGKRRGDL